ncbi:MAG TPA: dipeptide epimerase [Thermoplasmata archaeon]|nr:dipeptide epimerase [Thermoplasmata archaeon]
MKIGAIESHPRTLPRKEAFATSRHSSDVAHVVFVRIEVDGAEAWGAASPSDVTGETTDTVVAALAALAPKLRTRSFEHGRDVAEAMDRILPGNPAAKAAIDMAVFDALAKARGQPLYEMLGAVRQLVLTDRTVGLLPPEDAVRKAKEFVGERFRALKVKLAGKTDDDLARVSGIREAVGNHILLRTDANQAFSYRPALQFAKQAYPHVVEFLEQPLPADDLAGMRNLTEASPIPIMADESVHSPQDAAKVVQEKGARLVNLKLMKTGGIARAIEANAVCESAHLPTMIGCNAESQLSIAAGLHFAMSQRNVRFVDLDAHFNLAADPASGLVFEDGYLRPSGKPGLGVDVRL